MCVHVHMHAVMSSPSACLTVCLTVKSYGDKGLLE